MGFDPNYEESGSSRVLVPWTRRVAVSLVVEVDASSSGEGRCSRRTAQEADGGDLAQESEFPTAAVAGERCGLRELRGGFAEFSKLEADEEAGSSRGGTEEAVVADACEGFGQDVKETAPNELVGVKSHHGAVAGGAGGPEPSEKAFPRVQSECSCLPSCNAWAGPLDKTANATIASTKPNFINSSVERFERTYPRLVTTCLTAGVDYLPHRKRQRCLVDLNTWF